MSAASFNKVVLVGNLTRDPELRYTPKGTPVCTCSIAINRTWKDESGQQKEEVTFVEISFFGRQAEAVSQYKKKGHSILVEGRLRLEQWDDRQTNQKRSKLAVVGETCQFLGGGSEERYGHGGGEQRPAFNSRLRSGRDPSPAHTPQSGAFDDMPPDAEDDVPF